MNRSVINSKFFLIGVLVVVGPWSLYLLSQRKAFKEIETIKEKENFSETSTSDNKHIISTTEQVRSEKRRILILYGTCTGTAERLAHEISKKFGACFSPNDVDVKVVNAKDYDEFLLDQEDIVLFICSTWTGKDR
jgi:sulfite reductase alpha subunit-like flavoprotein